MIRATPADFEPDSALAEYGSAPCSLAEESPMSQAPMVAISTACRYTLK
jgi:hypothetical protein